MAAWRGGELQAGQGAFGLAPKQGQSSDGHTAEVSLALPHAPAHL